MLQSSRNNAAPLLSKMLSVSKCTWSVVRKLAFRALVLASPYGALDASLGALKPAPNIAAAGSASPLETVSSFLLPGTAGFSPPGLCWRRGERIRAGQLGHDEVATIPYRHQVMLSSRELTRPQDVPGLGETWGLVA